MGITKDGNIHRPIEFSLNRPLKGILWQFGIYYDVSKPQPEAIYIKNMTILEAVVSRKRPVSITPSR